jgi:hypothetical protein
MIVVVIVATGGTLGAVIPVEVVGSITIQATFGAEVHGRVKFIVHHGSSPCQCHSAVATALVIFVGAFILTLNGASELPTNKKLGLTKHNTN